MSDARPPRVLSTTFVATAVEGAFVVEADRTEDDRGFFARTFDAERFAAEGMDPVVAQTSLSYNRLARTLRGLHVQAEPHGETKLVRCTAGAIFDVVADVRPDSPTYRMWSGHELSAANRRSLYVPRGCAHGFLTLVDDAEVLYQISTPFHEAAAGGIRWDDPTIDIDWPDEPAVMSDRDRTLPLLGD